MANSRAAAASPGVSAPWSSPRRRSSWASPGTGPTRASRSPAGTRSPVSTVAPSSKRCSSPDRSDPASRARQVSATDRRSRCLSRSSSRPSSSWSNSTLPRETGTTAGRSATLATAISSPVTAARRTAEAATVSAAAMANRAETPERASIWGDSRTARVKRAMTSSRWPGTSGRPRGCSSQASTASWRIRATSSSRRSG